MHKELLFVIFFLLLLLIAVLHIVAIELYLYWTFWWFDILMHLLGGLAISVAFLWFFFFSRFTKQKEKTVMNMLVVTLFSVALVGISWEVFEIFAGIPIEANYAYDTTIDLVMDTVGALIGFTYVTFFYQKRRVKNIENE